MYAYVHVAPSIYATRSLAGSSMINRPHWPTTKSFQSGCLSLSHVTFSRRSLTRSCDNSTSFSRTRTGPSKASPCSMRSFALSIVRMWDSPQPASLKPRVCVIGSHFMRTSSKTPRAALALPSFQYFSILLPSTAEMRVNGCLRNAICFFILAKRSRAVKVDHKCLVHWQAVVAHF